MTTPRVTFDDRPLTEPLDAKAARAHVKAMRADGRASSTSSSSIAFAAIGGVVFLLVASFVFLGFVTRLMMGGSSGAGSVVLPLVFLTVIGGGALLIARASRSSALRQTRLDRFAQANGMTYLSRLASPQLPGMIFGRGSNRTASDLVRGTQPRFVEFANYTFVTGSGKNRTTHRWGYVAIKLDTPLPHIILDATGNNGLFGSNLPSVFDKDQRLSLEGDFDRYFSLYCPAGYERDALYLFTPDIMARFIDTAAELDVEIVDDWVFFYAKRDLSTLDPATWGWLFTAVAALFEKLGQWAQWRDDHLAGGVPTGVASASSAVAGPLAAGPIPLLTPPPGVAPAGRRLKGGVSWVSLLVFAVIGLIWCFSVFDGFGLFGR